ncbi:MAG TPA: hypothetical protein VMN36_17805 [Verrucomicrobiales bacterium]|nr:hypothetical protein [Verrucomicrobiales bacterium]
MVEELAKLAVTALAVLALSVVAERVSPRASGLLAGYPLGGAIALFFIGWENGAAFAASSAIHTLGGLTASLVFVYVYYRLSASDSWLGMTAASVGAIGAFLLSAFLLSMLSLGWAAGAALTAAAAACGSRLFRGIENALIGRRMRLSLRLLLLRSLVAGSIVLAVTGAAKVSGPVLAGFLAAFPITLFPLLLVVHGSHGRKPAHTIIKNFPLGLGSLLVYALTVVLSYERWGLVRGTAASFAVATLYLAAASWLGRAGGPGRER